jgi:hypothetical protein
MSRQLGSPALLLPFLRQRARDELNLLAELMGGEDSN